MSQSTQNSILTAARRLFLERGYSGASVDVIAATAGTTKQTVYRYYLDKRQLFTAVIEDVMGGPWSPDAAMDVQTVADLRDSLFSLAAHINSVAAEPDYIRLLRVVIAETITEPMLGKVFERGVTARALQYLNKLFTAAKKQELVTVESPQLAAQFFIGGFVTRIFLQGLLMQSSASYMRKQTRPELSQYVDEFMHYIANGCD